jgi:hypothetical protein
MSWINSEIFQSAKLRSKITDKVMTRTEFLKDVGLAEFTEEKYQDYLKIMKNRELILNKGNLFSEENQKV